MELLKGFFTVPSDVADERVRDRAEEYIRKYVDSFEKEGWKLLSKVYFAKAPITTEDISEGRVKWIITAYWDRKPVTQIFEVDEKLIPRLLETGKFTLPLKGYH